MSGMLPLKAISEMETGRILVESVILKNLWRFLCIQR